MARECLAQVLVVLTFSVLDGKGWCVIRFRERFGCCACVRACRYDGQWDVGLLRLGFVNRWSAGRRFFSRLPAIKAGN